MPNFKMIESGDVDFHIEIVDRNSSDEMVISEIELMVVAEIINLDYLFGNEEPTVLFAEWYCIDKSKRVDLEHTE